MDETLTLNKIMLQLMKRVLQIFKKTILAWGLPETDKNIHVCKKMLGNAFFALFLVLIHLLKYSSLKRIL